MISTLFAQFHELEQKLADTPKAGSDSASETLDQKYAALWDQIISYEPANSDDSRLLFVFLLAKLNERIESNELISKIFEKLLKLFIDGSRDDRKKISTPPANPSAKALNKALQMSAFGEHEEVERKERATLIARLLAQMTKADGQVLAIENFTAEAILYFKNVDHEKQSLSKLFSQYQTIVKKPESFELSEKEGKQLLGMTLHEKRSLIRAMSGLAACDGNIHEKEQALLKELVSVMKIDQNILSAG